MTTFVSGKHPVYHLLKARRRQVRRLYFSKGVEHSEKQIFNLASEMKVPIQISDSKELGKKAGMGVNHQGVLAETEEYPYVELEDVLEEKQILMLDEIQDPQNVGALCRSAYLFGFRAVLIPEHHSASVSQGVCHASVGAVEYLKICRVTNFAMSIELLKKNGFWIYGAEMEGARDVSEEDFSEKIVLIMGSEERGMRRLTKEKCDILLKVPFLGEAKKNDVDSLNASVAGGILMYEVFRRKTLKKNK